MPDILAARTNGCVTLNHPTREGSQRRIFEVGHSHPWSKNCA